ARYGAAIRSTSGIDVPNSVLRGRAPTTPGRIGAILSAAENNAIGAAAMRIVVYGPEQRVGALVGDTIVDLNRAFARAQSPEAAEARVPSRLEAFIGLGTAALDDAQRAIQHAASSGPDGTVGPHASEVKLHPPWTAPTNAC